MDELRVWEVQLAQVKWRATEHDYKVDRRTNRSVNVAAASIHLAIQGAVDELGELVDEKSWVVSVTHRGRVHRVVAV
jgi:hypothetical protein